MANSDWARPILYCLATPHFAFFTSVWIAVPWLLGSLGIEMTFLRARAAAARGDAFWSRWLGTLVIVLPWPWHLYTVLLWVHGGSAALAGALCAQFTAAVVAITAPKRDQQMLMLMLAPPVMMVFAMLAFAYGRELPAIILPVAFCSASGITVVMLAAAQQSYDSQQRVRQMRAELKAERDALDARVRARTRELEIATREAQAANVAKSQFIARMSHELRTPLNAVLGFSELAIDELKAEGKAALVEDVGRIHGAGRHLLSMVNDVLDFAKADVNDLTPCWEMTDVPLALRETTDAVRAEAHARGNRVELSIAPSIGMMESDPVRLRQALRNLLSNAVKFTSNGLISINAELEDEAGGVWLAIRVRDTGAGIAPEQMALLFQPFAQGDDTITRRADGVGLGLVLARHIARALGGDLTVESARGQGSTFTLRLLRRMNSDAARAVA